MNGHRFRSAAFQLAGWTLGLVGLLALGLGAFATGCVSAGPQLSRPDADYAAALRDTASQAARPDEQAVARIKAVFTNMTAGTVGAAAADCYADPVYFRDGFRLCRSRAELVAYLEHSLAATRDCRIDIEDTQISDRDLYLRWVMDINLRRDPPDRRERVIGMSHIRVDADGRVIFHQDYWDPTDFLYRRIPVANGLIQWVRGRL